MPRIPRSLLTERLRTLEDAGVVMRKSVGTGKRAEYHLTKAGSDLLEVVIKLGDWGQKWVNHDIGIEDVDPALLVWDIHRRVNIELLPEERVVVQLDFHGASTGTYWLVLEHPEPSACMWDPGFEVDLFVAVDTIAIHRVWMGMTSIAECVENGQIELNGLTAHVSAFPSWFKFSVFSRVKRMVHSG